MGGSGARFAVRRTAPSNCVGLEFPRKWEVFSAREETPNLNVENPACCGNPTPTSIETAGTYCFYYCQTAAASTTVATAATTLATTAATTVAAASPLLQQLLPSLPPHPPLPLPPLYCFRASTAVATGYAQSYCK